MRGSLLILLVILGCTSQPKILNTFTTKAERNRFVTEKTQFIDTVFLHSPALNNEKQYQGAFWATELMLLKNGKAKSNLKYALAHFSGYSENFRRSILQNIYTLYPSEFGSETDSLIALEHNEKLFAMMANYLIRNNNGSSDKYIKVMKVQFPDWQNNSILSGFTIEHSAQPQLSKDLINELIAYRKTKKEPTIFVFIHKDRDIPGEAIIQNEKGEFLKDKNDTLKIRLLARSITNMSGYLTNGNTPQGVLSLQGFASSDNLFIGKTPTIITTLPIESSLTEFSFGKYKNEDWTLTRYEQFFPESWKNQTSKNMAFYAGKAGRGEIIIHGTTIDTEFYKGQTFYPFTPSLGCICTLERWSEKDGSLIESEQNRLIFALKDNKIEKALMYIIEI